MDWRLACNAYARNPARDATIRQCSKTMAARQMGDAITLKGKFGQIDLARLKQAGKMHLIKSYRVTRQGVSLELYSALDAQERLARILGMFNDKTTSLNIDMSKLTDEQIARIASGEDPLTVLATTSQGRAGKAP